MFCFQGVKVIAMKKQLDELAYFLTALDHLSKNFEWGWQNALSIDTKISDGYISQIINKTRKPSFEIQVKIAKSLGYEYIDFLELGKRLIEEGAQPSKLAHFGQRQDITLADIARQREGQPRKSADPAAAGGLPEMLFASMKSQIDMLNDAIKEMRSERVVLVDALKADLERCRDTLSGQELHIHRLNETLDKVNADMRQMQDRMIEAARSGDIHHLEKISGAG